MTEKIDEKHARPDALIGALKAMEKSDDGSARAGLAALRIGLRSKDGMCIEAMPHVSPYLGDWQTDNERWFFIVATLFALHPQSHPQDGWPLYKRKSKWESESLGGAFAQLRKKSDSIEKRFQLLLACDEENLWEQLVQIVSLLKSEKVPLNWFRLLDDLTQNNWDDPERPLQLRWARDFYKPAANFAAQSA